MSLHTPRNNDRDQKSFTHNWQENYYEIQAWLQKNYQAMLGLLKEIKREPRPFTDESEPAEESFIVPGPRGAQGLRGLQGYPGLDADEPDSIIIMLSAPASSGGGGTTYTATAIGQILISEDASTFVAKMPVTDPTLGWLVDGTTGYLLVS